VLGGLLGAYHLSADAVFLRKAHELGDRLMPAFSSASPVPLNAVNLRQLRAHSPAGYWETSTSEVTTIQLEFVDLSRQTGDPRYEAAVMAVSRHVSSLPKKDGLVPVSIDARSGRFRSSSTVSMGAGADSYYEYLLKTWLQTGRTHDFLREDFERGVEGMRTHLVQKSSPNGLLCLGEIAEGVRGPSFNARMEHLACYLGGTLALASRSGLSAAAEYMTLAERLTETCWHMYRHMPTGLSPDSVYFNTIPSAVDDIYVRPTDARNLQRPETVESLFYLYRLTGNKTYQDWGWAIFDAFNRHTRLPVGYSSIGDVKSPASPKHRDKMESFWLAETLKYLYLLFSDNPTPLIPLDKFVFNTEAHPLPIYS